jgi:hypothetical protein
MARQRSALTQEILYLLDINRGVWTTFGALKSNFGLETDNKKLSNTMWSLVKRHGVEKEGVGWEAKYRLPKLTEADNPQELDRLNALDVSASRPIGLNAPPDFSKTLVPESEPTAHFQVIGSLYQHTENYPGGEFKGTILRAVSEGFSGTYLLTEL